MRNGIVGIAQQALKDGGIAEPGAITVLSVNGKDGRGVVGARRCGDGG